MHVFYDPDFRNNKETLSGDEFQHCVKVLRHDVGDKIWIIDGTGHRAIVEIKSIGKRELQYNILETQVAKAKGFSIHLMIAPTKNMDRMEWMVEKLGEIQVDSITFIETENAIRRKLRIDRLERKLVSALKQSKGPWKTEVRDLIAWKEVQSQIDGNTVIGYVEKGLPHIADGIKKNQKATLMIGPEGDFSSKEIAEACANGARKVSLGHATLRTETAGLVACEAVNFIHRF